MRIVRVDATPVAIPFQEDFHWPHGVQVGANLVIFSVETEDGAIGYGESVCDEFAAFVPRCELLARYIEGKPLTDVGAILEAVWRDDRWQTAPHLTQAALGGIEAACWDALGRALAVPSRSFFGGAVRDEVDFYGFVVGSDPETLVAHAQQLRDRRVIYMKIAQARDYPACVAAVRQAIGASPLLRIDCNEVWDAETAVENIRRVEQYDLDWVEQPVARHDVAGLAHVRRCVEAKIAADESVSTVRELRNVLTAGAADVVVQDGHRAGGLLKLRHEAVLCEAWDVMLNIHAPMQSELSFLAHVQVASTIPNLTLGNQMMHQLLAERLTLSPSVETTAGGYRLTDAPGHGFEIDPDAIANANERWHRDGSYVIEARG